MRRGASEVARGGVRGPTVLLVTTWVLWTATEGDANNKGPEYSLGNGNVAFKRWF